MFIRSYYYKDYYGTNFYLIPTVMYHKRAKIEKQQFRKLYVTKSNFLSYYENIAAVTFLPWVAAADLSRNDLLQARPPETLLPGE
jgi:hypothetical protein